VHAEDGTRNAECLVTFTLPLSDKLPFKESLELITRQGYQRVLAGSEIVRIDEAAAHSAFRLPPSSLTVVQDRLKLAPASRGRFVEACEQAYHFGKGKLAVHVAFGTDPGSSLAPARPKLFSKGFHCAGCDLDYREPSSALFSFNNPVGACPACKGFGRVISIDYDLAIPDRSKTLAEGCVKPWQVGHGLESQRDLMTFCKKRRIETKVPFNELSRETQDWVLDGDDGYDSNDPANSWPKKWYGVKGYFRWLESKSYKMHVRVLLSRYRAYTLCPTCEGSRFKPEALLYRIPNDPDGVTETRNSDGVNRTSNLSLADFYALPADAALKLGDQLAARHSVKLGDPLGLALNEVRARLRYLVDVGLGYLTLDRPTRTLSGGETERVNLTTCLGTRLVNTLFVLDEPSVGLHPRDTARLVRILEQLRDTGNTVVVVEHEASVMRAADQVVDLGPGQGEKGGEVVFCGPFKELLSDERSLTGQYLSGRKRIEIPNRRQVLNRGVAAPVPPGAMVLNEAPAPYNASFSVKSSSPIVKKESTLESRFNSTASAARTSNRDPGGPTRTASALRSGGKGAGGADESSGPSVAVTPFVVPSLRITNATHHNLKNLSLDIPLGRFVALTGVSGSGKTTLVREVLLPALQARLKTDAATAKASDRIDSDDGGDNEHSPPARGVSSIDGTEHLREVVLVDQSSLGKTPRSNPVVYIGAFEDVRELFAQTDHAKQRGLNASAFSFNSGVGQCERCRGAGFEKIEMQFLSDIFIRCPECNGRRYRGHILEVKLRADGRDLSIADLLDATVDDALAFLMNSIHLPAGRRAIARLRLLQDVGLGYLRLGQPVNTLSGGESQRLKLVSHLAGSAAAVPVSAGAKTLTAKNSVAEVKEWLARKRGRAPGETSALTPALSPRRGSALNAEDSSIAFAATAAHSTAEHDIQAKSVVVALPLSGEVGRGEGEPSSASAQISNSPVQRTLFLFDEPTTGLHFDDVRVLLQVFQRIVDAGHSVVVIEHNLDVIKCADWVIDLGPDAGERGGELVIAGTPEQVAACEASHTGSFLRGTLTASSSPPSRTAGRLLER
jgi:excinuclease ABC subunit A